MHVNVDHQGTVIGDIVIRCVTGSCGLTTQFNRTVGISQVNPSSYADIIDKEISDLKDRITHLEDLVKLMIGEEDD